MNHSNNHRTTKDMNQVNIIDSTNDLYTVTFKPFDYPNLMELIIDNLYDDIGECLGRGLCGTCHIKVISEDKNQHMYPNEIETLSKVSNSDQGSRLACQIILTEHINNMTFKVITEA